MDLYSQVVKKYDGNSKPNFSSSDSNGDSIYSKVTSKYKGSNFIDTYLEAQRLRDEKKKKEEQMRKAQEETQKHLDEYNATQTQGVTGLLNRVNNYFGWGVTPPKLVNESPEYAANRVSAENEMQFNKDTTKEAFKLKNLGSAAASLPGKLWDTITEPERKLGQYLGEGMVADDYVKMVEQNNESLMKTRELLKTTTNEKTKQNLMNIQADILKRNADLVKETGGEIATKTNRQLVGLALEVAIDFATVGGEKILKDVLVKTVGKQAVKELGEQGIKGLVKTLAEPAIYGATYGVTGTMGQEGEATTKDYVTNALIGGGAGAALGGLIAGGGKAFVKSKINKEIQGVEKTLGRTLDDAERKIFTKEFAGTGKYDEFVKAIENIDKQAGDLEKPAIKGEEKATAGIADWMKSQEDLNFSPARNLGKDIEGGSVKARLEWDYKKNTGNILLTPKTTEADLAHEVGHYFEKKNPEMAKTYETEIKTITGGKQNLNEDLALAVQKIITDVKAQEKAPELTKFVQEQGLKIASEKAPVEAVVKSAEKAPKVATNAEKVAKTGVTKAEKAEAKAYVKTKATKFRESVAQTVDTKQLELGEDFQTALGDTSIGRESKSSLPILAVKQKDGRYAVIDGNHRLARMMREGAKKVEIITDEKAYRKLSEMEEKMQNKGKIKVKAHTRQGDEVAVREYLRKRKNEKFRAYETTRYAEKGRENTDKFRGGTWYTIGEEKNYKFGDGNYKGVGGRKKLLQKIDAKNTLIIKDATLEDGSFAVINSGYENYLPQKYRKLANDLYDNQYKIGEDGYTEADFENDLMNALYDAGIEEDTARAVINSSNKLDAALDLIISKGLKERGYDALILQNRRGEQVLDEHIFKIADDEKFRLKDDFKKATGISLTDDQEKKITALNKRIFGDANVKVTAQILTPSGQKALGSYRKGMINILKGQADAVDTFYHEAVHKYFDVFTTADEQADLLILAKKAFGSKDFADAEEALAENFIKYAKSREGVTGKLKTYFDIVIQRVQKYFGSENKINEFYNEIVSGKKTTVIAKDKIAKEELALAVQENPILKTLLGERAPKPVYMGPTPRKKVKTEGINWDHINTSEDTEDIVKTIFSENKEFGSVRPSRSNQDIIDGSRLVGLDMNNQAQVEGMLQNMPNANVAHKLKQSIVDSSNDLMNYLKSINGNPTEEQSKIIKDKFLRTQYIAKTFAGMRTEASHLLRSMGIDVMEGENLALLGKKLKEIMGESGDDTFKFLEKSRKIISPTLGDKILAVWYNAILSGWKTWTRNILDNTGILLTETFSKATNPTTIKEVPSFVAGMLRNGIPALKKAGRVLAGKEVSPSKLSAEVIYEPIFKNPNVNLWLTEVSGKMLDAQDVVPSTILKEAENIHRGFAEKLAKAGLDERDINALNDSIVTQFAERNTYRNKPLGNIGATVEAMSSWTRKVKLMKYIMPFTRVVGNVIDRKVDYMPLLNIARTFRSKYINEEADIILKNAHISPRMFDTVRPVVAKRLKDQQLGRFYLGLMVTAGAYGLKENISGGGPTNTSEKSNLEATGWRPYSIKIGNTWVPYLYFGPLSGILGAVGSINDAVKYGSPSKAIGEKIANGIVGFSQSNLSQSFLSGVSDLMDVMKGRKDPYKWARDLGVGAIPFPAFVSQTADLFNRDVKDVQTFQDALRKKFAFSYGLKPRLNALGESTKSDVLYGISPSGQKDNIQKKLDDRGLYVTIPTMTTKLGDESMTRDQLYEYTKRRGELIKKNIDRILSEVDKQKTQDEKELVWDKRIGDISEEVKLDMMKEQGIKKKKTQRHVYSTFNIKK